MIAFIHYVARVVNMFKLSCFILQKKTEMLRAVLNWSENFYFLWYFYHFVLLNAFLVWSRLPYIATVDVLYIKSRIFLSIELARFESLKDLCTVLIWHLTDILATWIFFFNNNPIRRSVSIETYLFSIQTHSERYLERNISSEFGLSN